VEFLIPTTNSQPRGIIAGPDGNLWFTEYHADNIGSITPSGEITEFALSPGSRPYYLTAGPDGNIWFAAFTGNWIGRITPAGQVDEFPLPTPNSGPAIITVGPDSNLWFTEFNGNRIGQMTTEGVLLAEWDVLTPNSGPLGITTGPEGNLWFTELNGNKIGRLRAPADHFLITAASTAVSGMPLDITVTALGPWSNMDTGYQGTVTFSTTDADAGVLLPADYTFTIGNGADDGVHSFSGGITLVTLGDQTLTVTDKVGGLTGSATITVGPSP
jgi:hypothetical protein